MSEGSDVPVLLGLGANAGDPASHLSEAVRRLREVVAVERLSSVYRTEPVGYADQPDFLNLVVRGRTLLPPDVLLRSLQRVERDLGRERPFANAPRLIDIDLLAYGNLVHDTPELSVPHPRLHRRGFVLVPLAEVAPEWAHPVLGLTAGEMLERAGPLERVELWGSVDA